MASFVNFQNPKFKLLEAQKKGENLRPIEQALRVHKLIKYMTILASTLMLLHMIFLALDFKRCSSCRRTIDTSLVVIGSLLVIPSVAFIGVNAYTLRNYTQTVETEIDLSINQETLFQESLLQTRNDIEQFNLEPDYPF